MDVPEIPNSPPKADAPRAQSFGVPQALFAGLVVIAISIYISFGIPNRQVASTPSSSETPETVAGSVVSIPDADDDPVLGDPNAPITMIEFSDFQCPYCRAFWRDTLPQIEEQYIKTGLVKFVYRDFPSARHQAAEISAIAGECAADQGKFWEFHDKIFAAQDEQGEGTIEFTVDDIKQWSRDIGLDTSRFDKCLEEPTPQSEVAEDLAAGRAAGIEGTPTFFINGKMLEGAHPFTNFKKVIDSELKNN